MYYFQLAILLQCEPSPQKTPQRCQVTHQPDKTKAFVLVDEDFPCLAILLKQLSHLFLCDIWGQIPHKEAASLGEGLFTRFPEILQVNSQAFI